MAVRIVTTENPNKFCPPLQPLDSFCSPQRFIAMRLYKHGSSGLAGGRKRSRAESESRVRRCSAPRRSFDGPAAVTVSVCCCRRCDLLLPPSPSLLSRSRRSINPSRVRGPSNQVEAHCLIWRNAYGHVIIVDHDTEGIIVGDVKFDV